MRFEDIIHKYKTFIFDNDGVILDSNQAKTEAFAKSVAAYEEKYIQAFVEYHVKNGGVSRFEKIDYFYREIMGMYNYEKDLENSLSIYASHAKKAMLEAEEIKGVIDFISKIQGYKSSVYVISGSDEEELITIYAERGISNLFKKVMGSPTSKKSHAKELIENKQLEYPILYFGDSITDFELAKEYKMDFIFVSSKSEWEDGFHLCKSAGYKIINDFSEIL
tara:strand:+ start:9433 stop:10095 length:663 start_codon:yes stop_codon:yes gene_type:complete